MKKYRQYFLIILVAVSTAYIPLATAADSLFIPDNPLRGRVVFEQKGCNSCHAVLGEGAFIGPDLGKEHFFGDFLELGRVMWNHSPGMTRHMEKMLKPRPSFTVQEIGDLFVFLYYLHYLGESGDRDAGEFLFKDKGCLLCHDEGERGDGAPPLGALAVYSSPIALAQAMWNHGPVMEQQMQAAGITRPRFEGEEVTHLAAYLKSLHRAKSDQNLLMNPGNPRAGEMVFKDKGCIECHSMQGTGGDRGPDLTRALVHRSVTEVAGIMWNHGPAMWAELGTQVKRVAFESDEMADVIAYLYFTGFLEASGDEENGARIFRKKGCSSCHDESLGNNLVPDLSQTRRLSSPVEMIQMMWNHAPEMEEMMNKLNIPWPELREGEMADLYLYIRSIQKP